MSRVDPDPISNGGFVGLTARQIWGDLRDARSVAQRRFSRAASAERCINIDELRTVAKRRLPRPVFDYMDGAAGDELTLARNRSDFRRYVVHPKVLPGGDEVDLSTTVLGHPVAVPVLGAPTGMSGMINHEGEVAIARAVHGAGSLYILSSVGSRSLEEVANGSQGPRWFQLYVGRDRGLTKALVERARETGYTALVLTVDVPRAGARERDRRNGFTVPPRVTSRTVAEGVRHPRWSFQFLRHPRVLSQATLHGGVEPGARVSLGDLINRQFDPALSWSDVGWLQEQWGGPIVIKGVLRAQDAVQAARLGVPAVVVSNHGGRQLDRAPSTISVLPEIVDAVGSEVEVYIDGGLRRGVEIVTALALGARACLTGRALLYGLGAGGAAGAAHAMKLLVDELSLALTLAGARSVGDLDPSWVSSVV
jgi:L-lactate dehydrogenase (cytochrome)